ncbi:transcription factor VOZ1 isoform X1 [Nicotiana tabacum]|uniref:Transcription factor VOZ1 isoform X1 n=3 Tax=Nicotiana tabacum TaxID=4097 RepID=A0AC58TWA6_TOBAC|nr:transcription factor VOZ1-like isoform X1 [Nicotiana tomentosiformis]XP_018625368.1 transcription factor VOZ1-like isoform X1 [Nicotiana tomentosiformis]XP_018625369.1 transcription factor VOZ1-like isoform X1 [Nicotiana tomentosiformis]
MRKLSKRGACKSASHQLFKDRAKNRVDDLQGVLTNLQSARKESRSYDVGLLEEQVHQMLREWKAELNEPSPASSLQASVFKYWWCRDIQLRVLHSWGTLQGGSLVSSSDIYRLLLGEEEDDATSALAAPKPEPDAQKVSVTDFQEGFNATQVLHEQGFQLVDQCKGLPSVVNSAGINNLGIATQLDYHSFDLHQEYDQQYLPGFDALNLCLEDALPPIHISPPASAFLGPKCALWDCPRPAMGSDWCQKSQDYCSDYHASLAPNEGYLGRPPVVRPMGIGLKDNLLFQALGAKAHGKDVGVPECEGAATAKSPWNAPELFDLKVVEGETIREWLFFDKPRRAFESGNRKQRSLPDYNGRGWHESRKQMMNEFGGLKRSYYMDPQPMKNLEWHLYEYEINKYDACALYRLELKLVDGKKIPKGKVTNVSVSDLQKQMGRLTAEFPLDNKRTVKGRSKAASLKNVGNIQAAPIPMVLTCEGFDYGTGESYDYLVDDLDGYFIT